MTDQEKQSLFLNCLNLHKNQIYRICWGFTDDSTEVQDLYQEVMVRIWKGIDRFEGKSSLSTWVNTIAVNTCIYFKKYKKTKNWLPLNPQMSYGIVAPIEETIVNNEKILQLRKAIQHLSKIDRGLILLLLEECSYQEIAEITGMTVNNVGVRINRAKEKLKKILIKEL